MHEHTPWGVPIRPPLGHPLGAGRADPGIATLPEGVRVLRDRVELADGRLARTFAVVGYPREVADGWLDDLVSFPGPSRFCQHYEPLDTAEAAAELRRHVRDLGASLLLADARGVEGDAADRAALADARALLEALARGQTRLFAHHLLVTLFARDGAELERQSSLLLALLEGRLLAVSPCPWEQEQAFVSTLPTGAPRWRRPRNLDSDALASALPFGSAEFAGPSGEVWGTDLTSGTLVTVDRAALPNPHALCLAGSGAGKSFWLKNTLLQCLLAGQRVIVLDPQGEYRPWAEATGGQTIRLGPHSPDRLNTLEPPAALVQDADLAAWRAGRGERVVALLRLLGGGSSPVPPAAVLAALRQIDRDPAVPTLADLAAALGQQGPVAARLGGILQGAAEGSLAAFAGPTNRRVDARATVFDVRGLVAAPAPACAAALLCLTQFILDNMAGPDHSPLVLAVDEAHHLLAHAVASQFLDVLFRGGRKRGIAVLLATQSIGDLLAADPAAAAAARAALANAATVFLMRQQNSQEIAWLRDLYHLGEREAQWLLACGPGEGLLLVGPRRALCRIEAPAALASVLRTDPPQPAARPP